MNERPIIFSGEMVKAILEGRKTQTRRVIKKIFGFSKFFFEDDRQIIDAQTMLTRRGTAYINEFCPYGQPGDRLWVRETFQMHPEAGLFSIPVDAVCYAADLSPEDITQSKPWHPSIHMPRWASRLNLEITNVRVELLQAISYKECCIETGAPLMWPGPGPEPYYRDMRTAFATLWDRINAKRGYSWDSNPWVWIIEFRRV